MDEKQFPDGFMFNPTDEELVGYYLKRKLSGKKLRSVVIPEVDVYKFAPWDLPDMAGCKGKHQSKWHFFCPRSSMYHRAIRATDIGYWKITGKDRAVSLKNVVVGMNKTLIFYRGRPPSGERTDWIMHEYRIVEQVSAAKDQEFVLCVIFRKDGTRPKTSLVMEESIIVDDDGDFVSPHDSLKPDQSETTTLDSEIELSLDVGVGGSRFSLEDGTLDDLFSFGSCPSDLLSPQSLSLVERGTSCSETSVGGVPEICDSDCLSYELALDTGTSWKKSSYKDDPWSRFSLKDDGALDDPLKMVPCFDSKSVCNDVSLARRFQKQHRQEVIGKVIVSSKLEHDDGFSWRKYGQKDILGDKYPRSYFRCAYKNLEGCWATKQVQMSDEEMDVFEVTYRGEHTCHIAQTTHPLLPYPSKPEIQEQMSSSSSSSITVSEPAKPQEIIECDDYLDTSQDTTAVTSFSSLIHFHSFSLSFKSPSTFATGDFFFGDGHDSYGNPDSELNNIINGDRGIRISTGADEDFVNCRRLASFHLKTVDLLLLLIPSISTSVNLRAECLVKLYLPGGKDALVQDLVNLKQLDLSCSNFTRIPDLSRTCKLQSLDLHGCSNLVDVSFIHYLTKLEHINLKGCTSLARLPSLMPLKLLLSLDLSNCINLRRLPPSLGCLSSLAALDLSNCKRIQNLPKGILRLKSVQTLSISGCSLLMEQASGPDGMLIENQVHPIAHSSSHASDEQSLSISGCSMLVERASGPEGMVIEHQVNPIAHSSSHASDEEILMSHLPVDKYVSKMLQPEEEIIISNYNSIEAKDAAEPSSTTQDLELHKEVLKAYMNMPVEKIHQANALYDVQRTVDLLIRRSPSLHESASLHDLTYCLEELQETVPETISRMHDARISKASTQVKLAHLRSSFVQSEGHYNGLAARLSVISDEEKDLDAEIDRLLAKRRELLA